MIVKGQERDEHIGFIRKVLGIVAAQMAVTFAMTLLASGTELGETFFRKPIVTITAMIFMLTSVIVLFCSKHARRTVPQNYIWLFIATLGEATFVSSVAAELTMTSVLTAILATCLTTAGLFFAALYTASSVNRNQLIMNFLLGVVGAMVVQVILLLVMLFTWSVNDPALIFATSLIMILVVGVYIVFALLMIVIPEVTDKEDYILAALRLYLEIVRLFFYILIVT